VNAGLTGGGAFVIEAAGDADAVVREGVGVGEGLGDPEREGDGVVTACDVGDGLPELMMPGRTAARTAPIAATTAAIMTAFSAGPNLLS
jgi:hypothetical protein